MKDCCFHLLTTVVGMGVVNMHRWYRNEKGMARNEKNDIQIRKFSNILYTTLEANKRKQYTPRRRILEEQCGVDMDDRGRVI